MIKATTKQPCGYGYQTKEFRKQTVIQAGATIPSFQSSTDKKWKTEISYQQPLAMFARKKKKKKSISILMQNES